MAPIDDVRHKLADAAKAFNWSIVFDILDRVPSLINSTRPGGTAKFTPLHQAAFGDAKPEVIRELIKRGASLTMTNSDDKTPRALAISRGASKEQLDAYTYVCPIPDSMW